MYREDNKRVPSGDLDRSDTQRISEWRKDVAYSTNERANSQANMESPRIIVNNITTTPPVEVYRVRPASKGDGESSTKAIIGTILGASAGAVVAYAMARSERERSHDPEPRRVEYRAIEATPQRLAETRIVYESPHPSHKQAQNLPVVMHHMDNSRLTHESPASRIKTMVSSQPDSACADPVRSAVGSHVGRTITQTNGTKVLTGDLQHPTKSRNSREKSVREVEDIELRRSPQATEIRSAKNIPLPPSRVSSLISSVTHKEMSTNDYATVVPDDSISQVSARQSNNHRRHEHDNYNRHHSKSEHGSKHGRQSSHGSSKTIKRVDKHSSARSSHRR